VRKHCTSSTTQIRQITTRSRAAGINFCFLTCWSQEVIYDEIYIGWQLDCVSWIISHVQEGYLGRFWRDGCSQLHHVP
jgi:hypothetical protein